MNKRYIDSWLVAVFFLLMLLGIIMVYSASAFYARQYYGDHFFFLKRYLLHLFLGLIVMAIFYSVPLEKLRGFTWAPLLISLLLLVWAAFVQKSRWITIGPVHFQAVDVAKFSLILFFADSLSRKEKDLSSYSEGLFPHLFYLGLFALLVLLQPDFSSAMMLVLIGLTMLFVAPVRLSHLGLTGLAVAPVMALTLFLRPYQMKRLLSFLNPGQDLQGAGYQVQQSLVSLGHGGISGVGFAGSTQKMFFLPEAHTDFIFAIIGEEWGLIGTLAVLSLFVIILVRGLRIARQIPDRFFLYLTVGITAHFVYYAMINMMVTLRLLPATGLPLPFISYGGTALLVSAAYAGILLRLANSLPGMTAASRYRSFYTSMNRMKSAKGGSRISTRSRRRSK